MPLPTDCPEAHESNDRHGRLRPTRLRRHLRQRREDESGLTTLEWLLIVAAVAGLAALAVVLVTNVVDETSEQISGSSARQTAARVAAQEIVDDSAKGLSEQPTGVKTWDHWKSHYNRKCTRLEITYGDAGITVISVFRNSGSGTGEDDDDITDDVTTSISPEDERSGTAVAWNPASSAPDTGDDALAVCAIS
ncbi:MAG: hypothetical protein OXE75_11020 [bacterium]|nr:hypothetical protein [bacterium]